MVSGQLMASIRLHCITRILRSFVNFPNYRTYCNLGARKKNNSNIVWRLNISFKNSLRSRLALILEWRLLIWVVLHALLQDLPGVAPRSRGVRGNVWARLFLSSFEVLYVDITFTKEFGHLYWVSNCPPCSAGMRIAAIYHPLILLSAT